MNKTNFPMKGFALGLTLKQRGKATQKWTLALWPTNKKHKGGVEMKNTFLDWFKQFWVMYYLEIQGLFNTVWTLGLLSDKLAKTAQLQENIQMVDILHLHGEESCNGYKPIQDFGDKKIKKIKNKKITIITITIIINKLFKLQTKGLTSNVIK